MWLTASSAVQCPVCIDSERFLLEVKDKLQQIMQDMRQETKTDQQQPELCHKSTMAELADKDAAVSHAISLIRAKVGAVPRSSCRLLGGLPTAGYTVPDAESSIVPLEQGQATAPVAASGARVRVSEIMEAERQTSLPKPIGPVTSALF
eukprot:Skav213634  [mRNA]  locus=scaffold2012:60761:74192:+ [translate_table: standard]